MKATFIGVPGEKHDSITMYGYTFPLDKAVEVSDYAAIRKLSRHPHFKAEGQDIQDANFREIKTTTTVETKEPDARKVADERLKSQETARKLSEERSAKVEKAATRDELEQLAIAMGVKVDARWSDDTLRAKLNEAA